MANEKRPERRKTASRAYKLGIVAAALGVLAACGMVAGIDSLEVGECKGGGTCASEGGSVDGQPMPGDEDGKKPIEASTFDGAGLPCKSAHGPTMVRVGTTTNNFCIDSTEITVKQYAEFTTAKGTDMSG